MVRDGGFRKSPVLNGAPMAADRGAITRYLPAMLMPLAVRLRNSAMGRAFTQRRLRGVGDEICWQFRRVREEVRRARLRELDEARPNTLVAELSEAPVASGAPEITVMCLSRRLGNRDSDLPEMLDTLIATVDRPDRVEILVKIDLDDDLPYYLRIKRRYASRLALRIFATERGRGPADMHHYYQELLAETAPSATVMLIVSDDAVFARDGWDRVINSAKEESGSAFFIGGELPFEQIVSCDVPVQTRLSGDPIYQYQVNNYPFVSTPLLKLIERTVCGVEGWTAFGSSMGVDLFISALLATVWEEHGISIYIPRDLLVERRGAVSFLFAPERDHIRNETLADILSPEHRSVRKQIADAIAFAVRAEADVTTEHSVR